MTPLCIYFYVTCLHCLFIYSPNIELSNMKINNDKYSTLVPSKLCGNLEDLNFSKLTNGISMNDKSLLEIQMNIAIGNQRVFDQIIYDTSKDI